MSPDCIFAWDSSCFTEEFDKGLDERFSPGLDRQAESSTIQAVAGSVGDLLSHQL